MADIGARLKHVIDEIMGNEALLDMLETEAATEILNWGSAMATSLVKQTEGLEDDTAELALLPRLKALRQAMRSVGNWAVGKYTDPESRVQLRDKLLEHLKAIFGEEPPLPSAEALGELLNRVDDRTLTPYQLISELRLVLESYVPGRDNAQA